MTFSVFSSRLSNRRANNNVEPYEPIRFDYGRRKLRILCLHGHGSNNDITSMQSFGLRLKREFACECEYLQGPHIARRPYPGLEQLSNGEFYTWGGLNFTKGGKSDWEESLAYLADYLKKNGPYDGVYGFSQGVAMITAFSDPAVWRDRFGLQKSPWNFAILACGGGSHLLPNKDKMEVLNIPSLHIKGKKDSAFKESTRIEDRWRSENRRSYTHKKGHMIDIQMLRREPQLAELMHYFFAQVRQQ